MSGTQRGRLTAYLERIELAGPPAPDPAGLETLQRAHRLAIPFENLDIGLGRPIQIDEDSVFDKLVTRGRGGYCFEHNRLLGDVLAAIGVEARPLLARVRLGAAAGHPPRTHVLLLADVGGRPWILDAGFGGGYVPVLPLSDGAGAATADRAAHRLRRIGELGSLEGEWLLERAGPVAATDGRALPHEGWQPQYSFDLAGVALGDLEQANHWTSFAPASRFTSSQIVTIALVEGFASLIDGTLKVANGEGCEEEVVVDPRRYRKVLGARFRLPLSEAEVSGLPLFAARR